MLDFPDAPTYGQEFKTPFVTWHWNGARWEYDPPVPPPTVVSLAPDSAEVIDPDTVVTVTGTGFDATSVILWDDAPMATTLLSPTQVTTTIDPGFYTAAKTCQVTVANGALTAAPPLPFDITVPVPTITAVAPNTQVYTDTSEPITVTGTNFTPESEILFKGAAIPTTYVSVTSLTATINPEAATPGAWPVTVRTGAVAGTGSVDFTVTIPTPTITAVAPNTQVYTDSSELITVTGTNFTPDTEILFKGTAIPTTYVSATSLTGTINPQAATPGAWPVTVRTLAVAGTGSVNFTVTVPTPDITSFTPNTAVKGSAAFTLTMNGSNFTADTDILYDGVAVATTFVSATQLTCSITPPAPGGAASAVIDARTLTVDATGGGSISYTEPPPPVPHLTSVNPSSASINTVGGNRIAINFYGSGFVQGCVPMLSGNDGDYSASFQNSGHVIMNTTADPFNVQTYTCTVRNPDGSTTPEGNITFRWNG